MRGWLAWKSRVARLASVVLAVVSLVSLAGLGAPTPAVAGERARLTWDSPRDLDLLVHFEGDEAWEGNPNAIPGGTLRTAGNVGFGPEWFTEDDGAGRDFESCVEDF